VISVNGVDEPFLVESVRELLHRHHIDGRGVAVAMRGEVVPRSQWDHVAVIDGTTIEIVTAAAGG